MKPEQASPSADQIDDLSPVWIGYWAEMPGWKIDEAAAIILGFDPDKIEIETQQCSKKQIYDALRRRLRRANSMGLLPAYPCPPKAFVKWCANNKITVPQDVTSIVLKATPITNWREKYSRISKKYRNLKIKMERSDHSKEPHANKMRSTWELLMTFASYVDYGTDRHGVSNVVEQAKSLGLSIRKDGVHNLFREAERRTANARGVNADEISVDA